MDQRVTLRTNDFARNEEAYGLCFLGSILLEIHIVVDALHFSTGNGNYLSLRRRSLAARLAEDLSQLLSSKVSAELQPLVVAEVDPRE